MHGDCCHHFGDSCQLNCHFNVVNFSYLIINHNVNLIYFNFFKLLELVHSNGSATMHNNFPRI